MLDKFKYQPIHSIPDSGEIIAKSPSNIALVKYWGKKPIQIPTNPSISFTLTNCFTKTAFSFKKSNSFSFNFTVKGMEKPSFVPKIESFLDRIKQWCPYLFYYQIGIDTANTFPHSSGIASSASGFSALALAIVELEQKITGISNENKYLKASFLSRLGSGSASRSLYGPCAIWGLHKNIASTSNQYAIAHNDLHEKFKNYQDTILLIDKGTKKVSSTVGHELMHNHPFSKERFLQANNNLENMISVLKSGDLGKFISISESEALTLHAMMMTSNPYFILMKQGTLSAIEKVWSFRNESKIPLSFTLDAGANVHLLYPLVYKQQVLDFIVSELIVYCENEQYICDEVGGGSNIISASYA